MKDKKNIKKNVITRLLIGVLFIIVINILSSFIHFRIDITSEKRYTLAPATKKILKDLDDIVYFKIYLDGDFPPGFIRLQKETREMLNQFRAYSNKIQFEFTDPSKISNPKQREEFYKQIVEEGVNPTELQVKDKDGYSRKLIFPGGVANYKDKKVAIQLIENQGGKNAELALNNAVEALEYNLANSLRKLIGQSKQRIAFVEGHGELPLLYRQGAIADLSEFYVVEKVEIDGKFSSLTKRHPVDEDSTNYFVKNNYDAIIIAKPTEMFSRDEKDKFIIDQYIMNGGKVLWLIDGVKASMDSLQNKSQTVGMSNDLNIDDMLFNYGVRINHNLVTDLNALPIPVVVDNSGTQRMIPWVFMPVLVPTSEHPIVRNVNLIRTEFISSIDTIEVPDLKKTILLTTSQYTKAYNAPVMINLSYLYEQPDVKQYNQSNLPVSVLVEGKFTSLFKNRIPQEIATAPSIKFLSESENTAMIFVADGDIIKNQVQYTSGSPVALPLGYDKYTQTKFGNSDFILNCIDYLCDESRLFELRSRKIELRLLDTQKTENRLKWQVINLALPVAIVILAAIVQYFARKKKYSY